MATVYWMDSCSGHYNDTYFLNKWTTRNNASIVVDATGGYDGRPCIKYAATGGGVQITRTLGQNLATLSVGVRFRIGKLEVGCAIALLDDTTHQVGAYLNTSGSFVVRRGGSGGTILGTSSVNVAVGDWVYLELKSTIHNTTGSFELKINGVTVASGSNVNTRQSSNAYANVFLVNFEGSASPYQKLMDVYAASDFLGDVKVLYLPLTGAGTTGAWTASTGDPYACVDETTTPNATDYIESGTPGNISTFVTTDISGTGTVHAVQAVMLAAKTDAGTRTAKCVLRSGGADREGSTVQGIGASPTYYSEIWNTDPADAAAWTVTKVNALEVGVKDQA
jgi:hypothetical protein